MDGNKVFVTLPCRIYTYHSRDCTWAPVLWHWFSLASKMATSLNFAWLIWGGGGSLNNFRSTICTCVGCFYQEQRQRFPFQAVFGAFYQEEQRLWCPFQCQYHQVFYKLLVPMKFVENFCNLYKFMKCLGYIHCCWWKVWYPGLMDITSTYKLCFHCVWQVLF